MHVRNFSWSLNALNSLLLSLAVFASHSAAATSLDLHKPARKGDAAAVEQQLSLGADVNALDRRGRTALHLAAERGHLDIIDLLLDAGSDINRADKRGQLPSDLASAKQRGAVVARLAFGLAQRTNTETAYRAFEKAHPQSKYAAHIPQLVEKLAWEKAIDPPTEASLSQFITRFPTSQHSADARGRLEALTWETLAANPYSSLEAYQKYLADYPDGVHRAAASRRLTILQKLRAKAKALLQNIETFNTSIDPDMISYVDQAMTYRTKNYHNASARLDKLAHLSRHYLAQFGVNPRTYKANSYGEKQYDLVAAAGPYVDVRTTAPDCESCKGKYRIMRLKVVKEDGRYALVPGQAPRSGSSYVDYWYDTWDLEGSNTHPPLTIAQQNEKIEHVELSQEIRDIWSQAYSSRERDDAKLQQAERESRARFQQSYNQWNRPKVIASDAPIFRRANKSNAPFLRTSASGMTQIFTGRLLVFEEDVADVLVKHAIAGQDATVRCRVTIDTRGIDYEPSTIAGKVEAMKRSYMMKEDPDAQPKVTAAQVVAHIGKTVEIGAAGEKCQRFRLR